MPDVGITTVALYMTALYDKLVAATGLAGVMVASGPVNRDYATHEALVLLDVNLTEEAGAIGQGRRDETYSIECVIQVLKEGEGEADTQAARDRAIAILQQTELLIRADPAMGLNTPGVQEVIRNAGIIRTRLRQGIQDGFRRCSVDFDVEVKTRK